MVLPIGTGEKGANILPLLFTLYSLLFTLYSLPLTLFH
jgi:hypothetical protein